MHLDRARHGAGQVEAGPPEERCVVRFRHLYLDLRIGLGRGRRGPGRFLVRAGRTVGPATRPRPARRSKPETTPAATARSLDRTNMRITPSDSSITGTGSPTAVPAAAAHAAFTVVLSRAGGTPTWPRATRGRPPPPRPTTPPRERQPLREQPPGRGQPVRQRRGRHLQLAGHVALRPAVQVAQHDRDAVLVRQAGQLRVEDRLQVGPGLVRGNGRVRHGVHLLLLGHPPEGRPAGLQRGPVGDPVEPGPDQVPGPDRGRPPGQDQERGLERVLGQVRVADDPPADAQDHRPVPADQRGERGLVSRRRRKPRAVGRRRSPRRGRGHSPQVR